MLELTAVAEPVDSERRYPEALGNLTDRQQILGATMQHQCSKFFGNGYDGSQRLDCGTIGALNTINGL